ncbi:MAG: valine--tRNA ligase [Blastocatellia bacterium]|nr:valine--tRNA ligase [Blastocatellia bacterium]
MSETEATKPQSATEIPKAYDPSQIEHTWYPFWEKNGYFAPQGDGKSYCIVIPPPNVTGYLHMGHALQHSLMDTLTRWRRMQGRKALWLPGTDHAGIATQMIVEKQLAEQKIRRTDLGREAFEKKVWEWKEHSGGTIQKQMRIEGVSVDWSRERFTLDEGLSNAVREVFVRLYREGLIYRGSYMVNWSPKLNTAVSDLEVVMKEVKGKLYHIRYPVAGTDEQIVVATTRPETMLGDTGVAVHPNDERYKAFHGKKAMLPLVGREIPFIQDEIVEMEFGTGVVKVTPSHDPNDFEMGKRHGLEFISVIGKDAHMTEAAGADFAGLDRYEARAKVVQMLEEQGYLVKIEEYTHKVGHCQRSDVAIEPIVSDQWFLNVKNMAEKSIQAVKDGRTRFVPDNWEKVFFDWLENIRPWCISRQLWWGHRIPAWFTPDGTCIVAHSEAEAQAEAGAGVQLTQETDVLDTWFSSALWPFSTLGWPDQTEDLKTFYPTDVLVTGFDIIFFWVARMMMTGLHFMDEVPFRTVFITGLVRLGNDKMSKTKGNVIDPLEVFNRYGTDAVRFTLTSAVTGSNDIKLLETKKKDQPSDYPQMEAARNFANKIWNATRFVSLNLTETGFASETLEPAAETLSDRWIISRLNQTALDVNTALENFRFHDAAKNLYKFFWNDFCDWYIELSKGLVTATETTPDVHAARVRIVSVLEQSLRLLHPIMPFITEELWQRLREWRLANGETNIPESICIAPYPMGDPDAIDAEAVSEMETLIEVITRVRNIRSEMNIPPSIRFNLHLAVTDEPLAEVMRSHEWAIQRLARVEQVSIAAELPQLGFAAKGVLTKLELAIPLEGIIDPEKERTRLEREIAKRQEELEKKVIAQLNAPGFAEKAPPERVAEVQARREELSEQIAKLQETLAMMG